jgi:hypothetical protein
VRRRHVPSERGSVDSQGSRKVQLKPPKQKISAKRLPELELNVAKQTGKKDTL